ncbi:hypothetical protein [Kaistella antarctica]|uniref:Uncharacterized protein n=1 Tax=Kaistella antarctica TaxID=266748 RepID=A0A3S4VFI9_9FLAO|nr:hypothetical protein [Kaistella antarctica]VEI00066.1 Uncharacterised protein [Kaistella antarctica]
MLVTKKQVTQLSYDITGFAIKFTRISGLVYWKASKKPALNLSWKETVIL